MYKYTRTLHLLHVESRVLKQPISVVSCTPQSYSMMSLLTPWAVVMSNIHFFQASEVTCFFTLASCLGDSLQQQELCVKFSVLGLPPAWRGVGERLLFSVTSVPFHVRL